LHTHATALRAVRRTNEDQNNRTDHTHYNDRQMRVSLSDLQDRDDETNKAPLIALSERRFASIDPIARFRRDDESKERTIDALKRALEVAGVGFT
jgi:hypothetical protein